MTDLISKCLSARFSRDVQISAVSGSGSLDTVKDHYLLNNFLIDEYSSPYIEAIVVEVCSRVGMPRENIHLFVTPSSDFQASCYAVSDHDCLISLSSALVDLLDAEELKFVFGHELGHYLFKHYLLLDVGKDSIEHLSLQRAQEISCDRIGLMSCEDLSHATSAIIKTTSGLKTEYLGLNVGQFIDQLSKLSSPATSGEYKSTHPTFLIRCRALLWFSTSIDYAGDNDVLNEKELDVINSRVETDLDQFIDGPVKNLLQVKERSYGIWSSLKLILLDGRFDRMEQSRFAQQFGDEYLEKVKQLISSQSAAELTLFVEEKYNESKTEIEKCYPISADQILKKINFDAANMFSK